MGEVKHASGVRSASNVAWVCSADNLNLNGGDGVLQGRWMGWGGGSAGRTTHGTSLLAFITMLHIEPRQGVLRVHYRSHAAHQGTFKCKLAGTHLHFLMGSTISRISGSMSCTSVAGSNSLRTVSPQLSGQSSPGVSMQTRSSTLSVDSRLLYRPPGLQAAVGLWEANHDIRRTT